MVMNQPLLPLGSKECDVTCEVKKSPYQGCASDVEEEEAKPKHGKCRLSQKRDSTSLALNLSNMLGKSRKSSSSDRNVAMFMVEVRLLRDDQAPFQIEVCNDVLGQWLFNEVITRLGGVLEREYFGLRYLDRNKQRQWMDLAKPVFKQLRNCSPRSLNFRIKHYPADPLEEFKSENTRYLLYLQLRRDLHSGRLVGRNADMHVIAALILQAEVGDHDKLTECLGEEGSLADLQMFVNMTSRVEGRIREFHRSLAGLKPSEAEAMFLKHVAQFDTYGVEPVYVQDRKGNNFHAGLSHEGVTTFSESRKVHVFAWSKISKISYDGKLFIIQVEWEQRKHTLGFKCQTQEAAEALWKWAVDRQCFFTLNRSVDAKESKSSGGLFKKRQYHLFTGRCQKELIQQLNGYQAPTTNRTEVRRSRSLLNMAQKVNCSRLSRSQEGLHNNSNNGNNNNNLKRQSASNISATASIANNVDQPSSNEQPFLQSRFQSIPDRMNAHSVEKLLGREELQNEEEHSKSGFEEFELEDVQYAKQPSVESSPSKRGEALTNENVAEFMAYPGPMQERTEDSSTFTMSTTTSSSSNRLETARNAPKVAGSETAAVASPSDLHSMEPQSPITFATASSPSNPPPQRFDLAKSSSTLASSPNSRPQHNHDGDRSSSSPSEDRDHHFPTPPAMFNARSEHRKSTPELTVKTTSVLRVETQSPRSRTLGRASSSSRAPAPEASDRAFYYPYLGVTEQSPDAHLIHGIPGPPIMRASTEDIDHNVRQTRAGEASQLLPSKLPVPPFHSPQLVQVSPTMCPEVLLTKRAPEEAVDQSLLMNYGYSLYPRSTQTVFRKHSPDPADLTQPAHQVRLAAGARTPADDTQLSRARYLHFQPYARLAPRNIQNDVNYRTTESSQPIHIPDHNSPWSNRFAAAREFEGSSDEMDRLRFQPARPPNFSTTYHVPLRGRPNAFTPNLIHSSFEDIIDTPMLVVDAKSGGPRKSRIHSQTQLYTPRDSSLPCNRSVRLGHPNGTGSRLFVPRSHSINRQDNLSSPTEPTVTVIASTCLATLSQQSRQVPTSRSSKCIQTSPSLDKNSPTISHTYTKT